MPAHPLGVIGAMNVRCKRRAEEEEEGVRRRAEAKAVEGKKNLKGLKGVQLKHQVSGEFRHGIHGSTGLW